MELLCYCVYIDGVLRIITKTEASAIKRLIDEEWIDEYSKIGGVYLSDYYGSDWQKILMQNPKEINQIEDVILTQQTLYC